MYCPTAQSGEISGLVATGDGAFQVRFLTRKTVSQHQDLHSQSLLSSKPQIAWSTRQRSRSFKKCLSYNDNEMYFYKNPKTEGAFSWLCMLTVCWRCTFQKIIAQYTMIWPMFKQKIREYVPMYFYAHDLLFLVSRHSADSLVLPCLDRPKEQRIVIAVITLSYQTTWRSEAFIVRLAAAPVVLSFLLFWFA